VIIAESIARSLPSLPKDTVLVPVPAQHKNVRTRSFDQTKLITQELSKILKLPYAESLVSINEKDRQSFRVKKKTSIYGQRVLLVDDTMHSGNTLNEVAKALTGYKIRALAAAIYTKQI